jgi:hypothetical protein
MILSHGLNDSGHIVVRFDPHDGACKGDHDVIVVVMPTGDTTHPLHVTLGWKTSALLSIEGTKEFSIALYAAIEFATTLENTASTMGDAFRMVDDYALKWDEKDEDQPFG